MNSYSESSLKFIHSCNLVHLDIKPENIFICYGSNEDSLTAGDVRFEKSNLILQQHHLSTPDTLNLGKTDLNEDFEQEQNSLTQKNLDRSNSNKHHSIYKIGDFGHTCANDNPMDVDEGDKRYLAHEIFQDTYDHLDKADIYALGVSIHEFWTNQHPPKYGPLWQEYRQNKLPFGAYFENLVKMDPNSEFLMKIIKSTCDSNYLNRPSAEYLLEKLKNKKHECKIINNKFSPEISPKLEMMGLKNKKRGRFSSITSLHNLSDASSSRQSPLVKKVKSSELNLSRYLSDISFDRFDDLEISKYNKIRRIKTEDTGQNQSPRYEARAAVFAQNSAKEPGPSGATVLTGANLA